MITSENDARAWLVEHLGCDAVAMERLEAFAAALAEENTRQNLVAAATLDRVWQRHIVDSAQLLLHVSRETKGTWLDLGTGAGFPGLVIAVLRDEAPTLMIESRSRRVEWLLGMCEFLGLEATCVVGSRLELVQTQRCAIISARAFAPLDRLVALSSRFSTSETQWLLPKGRSAQQELEGLTDWKHVFHVEQSLTDPDAGIIVGRLLGRKGKMA